MSSSVSLICRQGQHASQMLYYRNGKRCRLVPQHQYLNGSWWVGCSTCYLDLLAVSWVFAGLLPDKGACCEAAFPVCLLPGARCGTGRGRRLLPGLAEWVLKYYHPWIAPMPTAMEDLYVLSMWLQPSIPFQSTMTCQILRRSMMSYQRSGRGKMWQIS